MSAIRNGSFSNEKRVFGQLFKQCDPDNIGVVTGEVARTLFERSGLPPSVLGEIWQYADAENAGFLDQIGFSVALRFIGHIQNGQHLAPNLGQFPGPLPRFGQSAPALSVNVTGTNVTGGPAQPPQFPTSSISPPPMSPGSSISSASPMPPLSAADRVRFSQLFVKSAPTGVLDGNAARGIFLKARLPNETLGQIWSLADTRNQGSLDQTEFIIAMHLIQCVLNRSLKQLPSVLPPALYSEALGRPTSSSSFRGPDAVSSPISASARPIPPPVAGSRQVSTSSVVRHPTGQADWIITPAERAKFDSFFLSLDKSRKGVIGAEEVVPFLTTSHLPEETLAQVWDLSDVHNTGQFGRNEFAIAMYLIQHRLAGKELPVTLPQQLLLSAQTSQTGALQQPSSPTTDQAFYHRRAPAPPAAPVPRGVAQANAHAPASSMSDLVALNDLFSTPSTTTPASTVKAPVSAASATVAPIPTTAARTSAPSSTPVPASTASTSSFPAPFIPTSSFGQSIRQEAPRANPTSSPPPSRDLLADSAPAVSPEVSKVSTEIANISNQVSSISAQTTSIQGQRQALENQLAPLLSKKAELESQLANLRREHESEIAKTKQIQDLYETSRVQTEELVRELTALQASYQEVLATYQETSSALSYDQQENIAVKERIRSVNEETVSLKSELIRVQKEARQQHGLLTINRKQLSVSEEDRNKVQNDLQQAQEVARAPITREPDSGPSIGGIATIVAAGVTGVAGAAVAAAHSAPSTTNPFFTQSVPVYANESDAQATFEEAFSQMDIASPSTAEPARSSTHNTVDTPSSSPPTSDFQVYNPGGPNAGIPAFILPIARPESATSSVQNNPPLSVRGDLDISRPDSPEYPITSDPVSGIVPPEDLEVRAPKEEYETPKVGEPFSFIPDNLAPSEERQFLQPSALDDSIAPPVEQPSSTAFEEPRSGELAEIPTSPVESNSTIAPEQPETVPEPPTSSTGTSSAAVESVTTAGPLSATNDDAEIENESAMASSSGVESFEIINKPVDEGDDEDIYQPVESSQLTVTQAEPAADDISAETPEIPGVPAEVEESSAIPPEVAAVPDVSGQESFPLAITEPASKSEVVEIPASSTPASLGGSVGLPAPVTTFPDLSAVPTDIPSTVELPPTSFPSISEFDHTSDLAAAAAISASTAEKSKAPSDFDDAFEGFDKVSSQQDAWTSHVHSKKSDEEFPPIRELEPLDDDSSDEDAGASGDLAEKFVTPSTTGDNGPATGIVQVPEVAAVPISSTPEPTGLAQTVAGTDSLNAPNTTEASNSGFDFTPATSSTSIINNIPPISGLPPSYASSVPFGQSFLNATTEPTPEPVFTSTSTQAIPPPLPTKEVLTTPASTTMDAFADAFDDLSEAREEKVNNEDFSFGSESNFGSAPNGLNDVQSSLNTVPTSAASTRASIPTSNDEWEQLFAGFSASDAAVEPPHASAEDIDDAFSFGSSPSQQTFPAPTVPAAKLSPNSAAVQELIGMGFSRDKALDALRRKNYNLPEATNYLLDH